MTRIQILIVCCVFLASICFADENIVHAVESGVKESRPNIVWIFSDDHSYQTIGAYGGRLQSLNPSPNIDRLAKEGMRFDRCYVGNSICAPSRATLLTGKHSHMNGKYDNRDAFDHNQQQFQKILQGHGYQTVMIGKIHLNGMMQGFDYWEVLPGQGKYYNPDFVTQEGKTSYTGHVSDIVTDKAIDWLDSKRDGDKPFMLMVHHKAPHRSWIPAERHMEKYADTEIPEPANLYDDYSTRGVAAHEQTLDIRTSMTLDRDLKLGVVRGAPESQYSDRKAWFEKNQPEGRELLKWKYQAYMKDYMRCTWGVDESIGRILDALEAQGLTENTIVMYSSDQGFYMGEHGWFDKRFMYEESFRTPLVARWPGKIKPGSVNSDLVQNIDFAETFLDLADSPIPDDMQGKSLVPLLEGETPDDWRESLYYHYYEYPGAHSVRRHEGVFDGRWKLIKFYGMDVPDGEQWELYDVANDPAEMNNVYSNPEYRSKIETLKTELVRLKGQYQVPDEPPVQKLPNKRKKKGVRERALEKARVQ